MIISYGRQNIDNSDIKFVAKSLKSKLITQGPLVRKFENSLKKKLKCKYATVVNNGSSALLLVGKILSISDSVSFAISLIILASATNFSTYSIFEGSATKLPDSSILICSIFSLASKSFCSQ